MTQVIYEKILLKLKTVLMKLRFPQPYTPHPVPSGK